MSIRLMSSAWRLGGMSPGAKLVLLALCDNASDDGMCFPSIRKIAEKCCMAERTVQGHISAFETSGLLTRSERPGRSTVYTIDHRRICTPAESAPPQNLHPAESAPHPAESAPHPSKICTPTSAESAPITINETSGEPSSNPKRALRSRCALIPAPEDIDPQVWTDWLRLRAAKKAPVTGTVIQGARAEAAKAGMTITEFLTEWCNRGSQGLKADWIRPAQGGSRQPDRQYRQSRHTGFDQINYSEGINDDGSF